MTVPGDSDPHVANLESTRLITICNEVKPTTQGNSAWPPLRGIVVAAAVWRRAYTVAVGGENSEFYVTVKTIE